MRKRPPTVNECLTELEVEEIRQQRVLEGWKEQQPKSLHLLELGILAILIAAVLGYVIKRWP